MLAEEQVKALELKGLTYWQCEGRDYALNLKTILDKKEKLLEQGIQIAKCEKDVISLMPASWYKPGTVAINVCNTIPLYVNTRTSTIVGTKSLDKYLCFKLGTLDLSKTYIRPTDLQTINMLSWRSLHIILSNSLDKPSITSLTDLFLNSKAVDVNFTDFRGLYIKRVDSMFEHSSINSITWDYADFSGVESAQSMFFHTGISSVDLSTFPMLPPEATLHIFQCSGLKYPYTERLLASGELQKWCKEHFQK